MVPVHNACHRVACATPPENKNVLINTLQQRIQRAEEHDLLHAARTEALYVTRVLLDLGLRRYHSHAHPADAVPDGLDGRLCGWLTDAVLAANGRGLRPGPYQRLESLVAAADGDGGPPLKSRGVAAHLANPALRTELVRQLNAPHHGRPRPVGGGGRDLSAGYYVGGPYLGVEQCLAVVLCLAELLAADAIHAPVITALSRTDAVLLRLGADGAAV